MAHNYEEQVKEKVIEWFNDNIDYEYEVYSTPLCDIITDWDNIVDMLERQDSITGSASGSYYCNRQRAKEMVCDNFDEIIEALTSFFDYKEIGEMFMNEEWERIDVNVRCYYLRHIDIDEISYDITEAYIEALRG